MKKAFIIKLTLLITSMMTMMAGALVAPSLPQINKVFDNVEYAGILTRLILTLSALFITLIVATIFFSIRNRVFFKY